MLEPYKGQTVQSPARQQMSANNTNQTPLTLVCVKRPDNRQAQQDRGLSSNVPQQCAEVTGRPDFPSPLDMYWDQKEQRAVSQELSKLVDTNSHCCLNKGEGVYILLHIRENIQLRIYIAVILQNKWKLPIHILKPRAYKWTWVLERQWRGTERRTQWIRISRGYTALAGVLNG